MELKEMEEKTAVPSSHLPFGDFPEDIQVNVLSFLTPTEISALACTSRRFASLCSPTRPSPSLWLPVLSRRWGAHTALPSWSLPPSPALYRLLHLWDPLIGFWRRIGNSNRSGSTPPFLLFEWGPSFITASTISPSSDTSSYKVLKTPFLWMGVSTSGEPVNYRISESGDPVSVNVSFLGSRHFVVEETCSYEGESSREVEPEGNSLSSSPPPDAMMFEIYEYLANRTSPGGGQRRRKGRDRSGKRRWEPEHFVKITDVGPTPARPLQGLWKGICEGLSLDFFLVTYDDVGGVTCRRVGDSSELFSGYSPVFWTSHTTFLESPFSTEEQDLYTTREHVAASGSQADIGRGVVSRILSINSSYELVLPGLAAGTGDPRNVEGRIWEYDNGTFGFGFLRDDFIIDLKHIALDGRLLDAVD